MRSRLHEGRQPSKNEEDMEIAVNRLIFAHEAGGFKALQRAAFEMEAKRVVPTEVLGQVIKEFTRTGMLGGEKIEMSQSERWSLQQYARDLLNPRNESTRQESSMKVHGSDRLESKAFQHGTVRRWSNGTHMKNGARWERVKTGRQTRYASRMPDVQHVVDPNVTDTLAVSDVLESIAYRLYEREGGEVPPGYKMVFGKLRKLGKAAHRFGQRPAGPALKAGAKKVGRALYKIAMDPDV